MWDMRVKERLGGECTCQSLVNSLSGLLSIRAHSNLLEQTSVTTSSSSSLYLPVEMLLATALKEELNTSEVWAVEELIVGIREGCHCTVVQQHSIRGRYNAPCNLQRLIACTNLTTGMCPCWEASSSGVAPEMFFSLTSKSCSVDDGMATQPPQGRENFVRRYLEDDTHYNEDERDHLFIWQT